MVEGVEEFVWLFFWGGGGSLCEDENFVLVVNGLCLGVFYDVFLGFVCVGGYVGVCFFEGVEGVVCVILVEYDFDGVLGGVSFVVVVVFGVFVDVEGVVFVVLFIVVGEFGF